MNTNLISLPLSLSLTFGLLSSVLAQDVRELSTPTNYAWYYGASATTITTATQNGYRPVDLEVEGTNPLRFTAALVQNTGDYASGYWWYYGLTATQLSSHLNTNNARLIDLEAYEDGGQTRFACVMVPNTGNNAKTWWYYYGQSGASVSALLGSNNARPVDIDSYVIGNTTYYSVVMISNTGNDYRNYAWYYNVSLGTVQASINNGRRLYDFDRRDNGNYDAVLVTEPSSPPWTYWYGLTSAQVVEKLGDYGHRPIDLETYDVNGQRRFLLVTINNSNALTTSVGQMMRNTTDGGVGCYLRRINGSELASLNGSRQFEPASTMKTLHHVHAFRRLFMNQVSLNMPMNVFTATSGSCPVDNNPVNESLTTVLRAMMEQSDNNRTQAVAAYFGEASINATAAALGMSNTSLNHRIGCAGPAISNPNQITLRDLCDLHTQVANGYLGSWRDEFYEHMLNSKSWGGIDTVIGQGAAQLGVSPAALNSFNALVELARKGGSYTLNGAEFRSGFGWIRIPFRVGNQIDLREYAVGAYVSDASNGTNAGNAVSQAVGELLRPTLHAALATWDITSVAVSVGTGCGSPRALFQSAQGLPALGQTPVYRMTGGTPNSLAVMTFGFSDQFWGATPLPASLGFAGAPGCFVYNDALVTEVLVASATGGAQVPISLPTHYGFLGMEYFTQFFSLGGSLMSSNGMRSVVGD